MRSLAFSSGQAAPKGNLVLLHGLNDDPSSFLAQSVFADLRDALLAQEWTVTVPAIDGDGSGQATYLQGQFTADPTGATHLADWLAQWDDIVTSVESTYGAARLMVVGISWGGLYALHAMAHSNCDACAVHLPAADPNYLTEFSSYDLGALSTFPESELSAKPTLIQWATDDTRVGYTAAQSLAAAVGADTREYTSLGHSTTTETNVDVARWVRVH